MEYLLTTALGQTNYSLVNITNIYNFCISLFEDLDEEQKRNFVDKMKFQIGKSFVSGLKSYIFNKNAKHIMLDYLV